MPRKAAKVEPADTSLEAWYRARLPAKFTPAAHHLLMCRRLQKLADREGKRKVMMAVHPGAAKTELGTCNFVPWYMSQYPDHNVMELSYSDPRARKFGRRIRNICNTEASSGRHPGLRVTNDSRANNFFVTEQGNEFYAAGFDGPIAGDRVDCIPDGTWIETERARMDIATLVGLSSPPRVLSYNHGLGRLEWNRIIAARSRPARELIEITTRAGRTLRVTRRHRICVGESDYERAYLLRPGDRLVALEVAEERDVQELRSTEIRQGADVSTMLLQAAPRRLGDSLRMVQRGLREAARRIREGAAAWADQLLLLQRAPRLALLSNSPSAMPGLRQVDRRVQQEILLDEVQEYGQAVEVQGQAVSAVRDGLRSTEQPTTILHASLRGLGARGQDAWRGELALQGRRELRQILRRNEHRGAGAGPVSLRGLSQGRRAPNGSLAREDGEPFRSGHSPHRREPKEQCSAESVGALQEVPRHPSQVAHDSVAMVRDLRCNGVRVHDIQVENASNFFANNILTHNCLVIDDPVKSLSEAQSEALMEERWDIYRSVVDNRLKPGGIMVMLLTRFGLRDLAALVLEGEPDEWDEFILPAEDEKGRFLWEEYLGRARYEKNKRDPEMWWCVWMQQPRAFTNAVFAKDWLCYYDLP